jgi:aldehyde dehydrogenase (NAD+)
MIDPEPNMLIDPKGFFVEPTMFTDVDNSMAIAQEEIFGPVLVVIPFGDDDDAVQIANESPYGLSGAVHSGSPERSFSPAQRVRTGTMSVNGGLWYGADVPFGGFKDSGIGATERHRWIRPVPRDQVSGVAR